MMSAFRLSQNVDTTTKRPILEGVTCTARAIERNLCGLGVEKVETPHRAELSGLDPDDEEQAEPPRA